MKTFPKIIPSLILAAASGMPFTRARAQDSGVDASASGSAVVASTTSMAVLDNKRKLAKGDRLSYRVVEERRPPVSLFVTDSGEVEVPLIGRVQAEGRTLQDLAYAIKSLLEADYFHKATVIVGLDAIVLRSPGRIYLSGAVRAQGPMDMPPDEELTLSKAILKAGGLAEFANGKKVQILRKKSDGSVERLTFDLDEITKKGRLDKDPRIQPEDTIYVPEKFVNF